MGERSGCGESSRILAAGSPDNSDLPFNGPCHDLASLGLMLSQGEPG